MQTVEPVVASYGLAKTATLTILGDPPLLDVAEAGVRLELHVVHVALAALADAAARDLHVVLAWVVKRSEVGNLGGLRLKGHDLSVGSDLLGLSPRVLRAAPSRQMQSVEPVVASYGAGNTATLTILACPPT
tara:strand:+ start:36 stop:431 length:396 start_codon:yes stop_codon:yes gene_type:complete